MPSMLSLFCGQGGADAGYDLAGFDVTGVDIVNQPRYPFEFIRGDVFDILRDETFVSRFDVITGSPPCQGYSVTRVWHRDKTYPLLIDPFRNALIASGKPYVIENVEGASDHMRNPVLLCGPMFGLRTYRHRLFECAPFQIRTPPHLSRHPWRQAKAGRRPVGSEFSFVVGNCIMEPDAIGVDWMDSAGFSQAIPARLHSSCRD